MPALETHRRALLGAIIAAPVLAAPALASGAAANQHRATWDRMMADYQAASAASVEYDRNVHDALSERLDRMLPRPANDAGRAAWDAWWKERKASADRIGYTPVGEKSDQLNEKAARSGEALLMTPAPDGAALLWKLEWLFGPEARKPGTESGSWDAELIDPVMDDARRLFGGEVA